jgi:uncharacterized RDD family membrane protein YckC
METSLAETVDLQTSARAAEDGLEPAGFWLRALAHLIDWVVLNGAAFITAFLVAVLAVAVQAVTGKDASGVLQSIDNMGFIGWIGGAVTFLSYHTLFEGISGSTVGKRIVGMQVIAADGRPIRLGQGAKRSLAFFIDSLFFGMIGAQSMNESPEKKRIGDHWAETRVVRRRSLPVALRTPAQRMLIGFMAAAASLAVADVATFVLNHLWYTRG